MLKSITFTVFDTQNCIDIVSVNEVMTKLKSGPKIYKGIVQESNGLKYNT